ncbi:MAG: GNAT family N-acetyltransferase [Thermoguttaceae bacterium]
MFPFYQHMCKNQELFLLVARGAQGEVRGIAPLVLRRERIITENTFLEFIGQRQSYYLGVIANQDACGDVYPAICDYVFENRRKWDAISLANLANDELLKENMMEKARSHNCFWHEEIRNPCKVVRLGASFDAYISSLDPHIAKKLKYCRRSMDRDHVVETTMPADEQSLNAYWRAFLELHQSRVRSKCQTTIFANHAFQEFSYSVVRAAYAEGNLRLVALKLDDEIRAVLFGVVWNKTFYFLNIGYKELSKYSLGHMLPVLCIEAAICSGLERFDFMGGGGEYKERLGGVDQGGMCLRAMKPTAFAESAARKAAEAVVKRVFRGRSESRTKRVGAQ